MLLLNIIRRYKTQKGIKVLLMNYYKHVYYAHFFLELLQVQDKINCSSSYLLFPPEVIFTKTTKIRFHCQRTEDYKACKQPFTPCNGSTSEWIYAKLHRPARTELRWELPQISSHLGVSGGHYLPNKDCQCLTDVFHNLLSKVSLRMFCARTGLISCFRKAITATLGRWFGATGKVSSRSKAKRSFTKWEYPNSAAILILHC